MRILLVVDCLGSGGAQRQIVNLALGLSGATHCVEMFTYYPEHRHFAAPLEKAGILIHSSVKRHRYAMSPAVHLRQLIRRSEYDAVIAFLPTPSFYTELARVGLAKTVLIVSERSSFRYDRLRPFHWFLQQAHRLADHITVNSHHQRHTMARMFPWMHSKLSTIYNGVDLETFYPNFPEVRRAKGDLDLLSIGTVTPGKNVVGLIHGLAIHRELYNEPCRVNWAGKVRENTYQEANELIHKLGLEGRWHWLGERKDVPDLLRSHDALIHPSFHEGLPNAICEALACGCPVLASDVCDHPILVKSSGAGFLFDPHNPEEIADAIHRFGILTSEARIRMGQNARQFAESRLSIEAYVKKYENLVMALREREGRKSSVRGGTD